MMKATRKLLILAAVFACLGLFAAPGQAQAGWWHGGYSYYGCYSYSYCSPCWTPVCSVSVCDPCCGGWYLGVRPGPIRRALFGPYRWYRSYGCCSLCYCDPCCCYDPCCSSSVVDSGIDVQASQKPTLAPPQEPAPAPAPPAGTPNEPAPAPAPAPAPVDPGPAPFPEQAPPFSQPAPAPSLDWDAAPASPSNETPSVPADAAAPQKEAAARSSEGTISILVPDGAEVVINGYVTKSTGRVRRYVAQNLKPGLVYPFNIQVSVVRNGETLTDSRQVKLTGGALEAVVFKFDKSSVDRIAQAW